MGAVLILGAVVAANIKEELDAYGLRHRYAEQAGLPDPERDTSLLARVRCTVSDGWVVQLTDAPLDYDNPTHLDALNQVYERFSRIGGRVVP